MTKLLSAKSSYGKKKRSGKTLIFWIVSSTLIMTSLTAIAISIILICPGMAEPEDIADREYS